MRAIEPDGVANLDICRTRAKVQHSAEADLDLPVESLHMMGRDRVWSSVDRLVISQGHIKVDPAVWRRLGHGTRLENICLIPAQSLNDLFDHSIRQMTKTAAHRRRDKGERCLFGGHQARQLPQIELNILW